MSNFSFLPLNKKWFHYCSVADEMVDEIDDEEGDYAVVSKAKVLDPSVVKCKLKKYRLRNRNRTKCLCTELFLKLLFTS